MENNKRYWRGIEEFTNDTEFVKNAEREFPEYLPMNEKNPTKEEEGMNASRRDFMKLMGFSVAAATLAACEAPVKKIIPYLNKPEDIEPGIPNYYASTYFVDNEYASIVVKTREGRPIKIEGNDMSPVSMGGTTARIQASVLDLYDTTRYQDPMIKGKKAKMEDVDKQIMAGLNGNIRIVSHTIISPSTKEAIKDFTAKYPSAKHVMYDPNSAYGILKANKDSFGKMAVPNYDFSKADVIVSIDADFLGTWVNPVAHARQYAVNRKLKGNEDATMSRHYQFESRLSLTGSNADYRVPAKPSQLGLVVAALHSAVTGGSDMQGLKGDITKKIAKAAKDLQASKGKSLVVCGLNDPNVQTLVNAINNSLNNYGKTIDIAKASNLQQGDDVAMNAFIDEVKNGSVNAVIFYGANPVYNHPRGAELKAALSKVKTKVSLAQTPDETTALCDIICPDNHFLESWSDAEPVEGMYSVQQPTIRPLFRTRAAQESFLTWAGDDKSFYDYLRGYWKKNMMSQQSKFSNFEDFWAGTLHNGTFAGKAAPKTQETETPVTPRPNTDSTTTQTPAIALAGGSVTFNGNTGAAMSAVKSAYKANSNDIELSLYQKISMGSGYSANNPWLQEMADPISRACWDNYLAVSLPYAKEKGLKQGDIVTVSAGKISVEVPILVQPGQTRGTASLAVGYGRDVVGKVGKGSFKTIAFGNQEWGGKNAFPFATVKNNIVVLENSKITIAKTEKKMEIAQVQTHHTIMGRDIVQGSTFKKYKEEAHAGRTYPKVTFKGEERKPYEMTLWKSKHKYPNHSWGMVVDLNSCIGCGACTIACQAENNVPVVGKQEVLNRREMHWIRIDRYYTSSYILEENQTPGISDYRKMEDAAENPQVVFQPMMCQHCNNAPCETVCPVLATTHSTEGLNQMAYNRCFGTRYCANNCPYKVRRFNWFNYFDDYRFKDINYSQSTDLGKMVLNPDVTVRSRGVMEKCSMCVQRIQAGKLQAKKEGRPVKDGDIQVACAQACPTQAITFGDMNDGKSNIFEMLKIREVEQGGEEKVLEETGGAKTKSGEERHMVNAQEREKARGKEKEKVWVISEPRAYHVLESINVRPQVSYLTKIRNNDNELVEGIIKRTEEERKEG
ncbi:molybdopterin oxidoreductase [marine bacterium AO1-C]|nr:molybdopterin oxidoreductase [marine bacterium AO1-C]